MKKKTTPQLVNKAAERLQLLVRIKAADDNGYVRCVTCGCVKHYKDGMQGGHFIARGNSATKLMEENVHPQCDGCNGFGMKFHNKEAVYTLFMIETYGRDFVDELLATKGKPHKWYKPEVEDLLKDFNEQIKEHELRVI